ncbi:MAG: hypothetical protein MRZ16_00725 [Parvimonas sp.]|nr:hypothetical protein [Parvimonas sp.]
MKVNLNEFFKNRRNKVIACGVVAGVILTGAGIFVNLQMQTKKQEELRIAEEKAKEEKEKADKIAKAEEEKKAKELEEKKLAEEKAKKEQEEKEKVEKEKEEKEKESGKAEVDERESKGYNGQGENKVVNNKTTSNNNSSNTNINKNNSSNNNSNSNNNKKTWEVEGDGYATYLGNSGMFFNSKGEADNWAFAQLENSNSSWKKSGYRRFATSQCKHNGKIGWTISFR